MGARRVWRVWEGDAPGKAAFFLQGDLGGLLFGCHVDARPSRLNKLCDLDVPARKEER